MSRSINLAQGPWTNLDEVGLKSKCCLHLWVTLWGAFKDPVG